MIRHARRSKRRRCKRPTPARTIGGDHGAQLTIPSPRSWCRRGQSAAPSPFGPQDDASLHAYASPSKALGQDVTTTDESMTNAFTSLPSREMVQRGSNAFTEGESAGGQSMPPQAVQPMYPRSPYGVIAQ